MGKEWAKVRLSFVLSFLACLVLLPVSGYLGHLAAARIAYRYEQSKSFNALGRQDAQVLRRLGETAYALNLSQVLLLSKTKASFERSIYILQEMRPKAAPELWPIFDLRIAEDHAVLARVEGQANKSAQAAAHRRHAQDMLRSLGWQDVSESMLEGLADRQLKSGVRSEREK